MEIILRISAGLVIGSFLFCLFWLIGDDWNRGLPWNDKGTPPKRKKK